MEYERLEHSFPPVWDENSTILILGSFPSVKSREEGFFYGHPRNRFWDVLARILNTAKPVSIPEKKNLLLSHGIALWDVIASCEIKGSSDSSIRNVTANDFTELLACSRVTKIYTNGQTAGRLYQKYAQKKTGLESVILPSTSPANAAYSLDKLLLYWRQIRE